MGKLNLVRGIDIISMEPYDIYERLIVSFGYSQKDLWNWIKDARVIGDDFTTVDKRRFHRKNARFKDLVYDKDSDMRSFFERVNDPCSSLRGGFCYSDLDGDYCLLLVLKPSFDPGNVEDMITLAHECLHVCQKILPNYLNRDIEMEAEAYFHSQLMRKVVEIYNDCA